MNNNISPQKLPFVSICTPTFNRRPFIPFIIQCFQHQTYPKERMEWIIVDDGSDKIEDLISHIKQVKYIKLKKKLTLGKKRNLMHSYTKGDIIVYMDDDDYYPPTRVSHAVDKLLKNPKYLIAGSSILYLYYKHVQEMWKFGPYAPNHATAATFAFRKELLKITKFEDDKSLAEEKGFLKNYSIPLFQLDPEHVILVFSHDHNTFDKKKILHKHNPFAKKSDKTVDFFIKEPKLKQWFLHDVQKTLQTYKLGLPQFKPDVLNQMKKMEKERMDNILKNQPTNLNQKMNNNFITMVSPNKPPMPLNPEQTTQLLQNQQNKINQLLSQVNSLQNLCEELQKQNKNLMSKNISKQVDKAANILL